MRQLTPSGQQALSDIAQRHGFSSEAVHSMLESVFIGNGSMAQFGHPEFGGSGQWMQGGMTMIGDMFNNHLKGRVDNLCTELSRLNAYQADLFVPIAVQPDWWGVDLRWPNSTGAQNGVRYAWFAQARRLAIEFNGRVTVYDTLDHQIGGVSQQQGGGYSVTFTSQYGYVDLTQLPVVSVDGIPVAPAAPAAAYAPVYPQQAPVIGASNAMNFGANTEPYGATQVGVSSEAQGDIVATIEKLAQLQARGILTNDEFTRKKADLLSRL